MSGRTTRGGPRRGRRQRVASGTVQAESKRHLQWTLLGIFLMALIVRLVYLSVVLQFHSAQDLLSLFPDSTRYLKIAHYLFGVSPDGEKELLFSGPGYGLFLGTLLDFVRMGPARALVVQTALSSLNCVLVALLARRLFPLEHNIPVLSGLLTALSPTSIILSSTFMTEPLFLTLIGCSVLAFLEGIEEPKIRHYLISGTAAGMAAWVRPVAQYWPVLMLVWTLSFSFIRHQPKILYRGLTSVLVGATLVCGWALRNMHQHELPIFATAGVMTAARYFATDVRATETGMDLRQLQREFDKDSENAYLSKDPAVSAYLYGKSALIETLQTYPLQSFKQYLLIIYFNVVSCDVLHTAQIPQTDWEWLLGSNRVGQYSLICSGVSLVLLLLCREWQATIVLGSIYLYFALTSGITYWTGSRVFFPAQLSWSILVILFHLRVIRTVNRSSWAR